MLKILALLLFFAFRKKQKSQQSQSEFGDVPLWGWIFVSAIAAFGIILVVQKKRMAKQLPATRPHQAVPPRPNIQPTPPAGESLPEPDDLTKINGIGPKIQQALNQEGIYTYQQLAAASIDDLQAIMKRRKWHMSTCTTWPEQAQDLAKSTNG